MQQTEVRESTTVINMNRPDGFRNNVDEAIKRYSIQPPGHTQSSSLNYTPESNQSSYNNSHLQSVEPTAQNLHIPSGRTSTRPSAFSKFPEQQNSNRMPSAQVEGFGTRGLISELQITNKCIQDIAQNIQNLADCYNKAHKDKRQTKTEEEMRNSLRLSINQGRQSDHSVRPSVKNFEHTTMQPSLYCEQLTTYEKPLQSGVPERNSHSSNIRASTRQSAMNNQITQIAPVLSSKRISTGSNGTPKQTRNSQFNDFVTQEEGDKQLKRQSRASNHGIQQFQWQNNSFMPSQRNSTNPYSHQPSEIAFEQQPQNRQSQVLQPSFRPSKLSTGFNASQRPSQVNNTSQRPSQIQRNNEFNHSQRPTVTYQGTPLNTSQRPSQMQSQPRVSLLHSKPGSELPPSSNDSQDNNLYGTEEKSFGKIAQNYIETYVKTNGIQYRALNDLINPQNNTKFVKHNQDENWDEIDQTPLPIQQILKINEEIKREAKLAATQEINLEPHNHVVPQINSLYNQSEYIQQHS